MSIGIEVKHTTCMLNINLPAIHGTEQSQVNGPFPNYALNSSREQ